MSKRRKPVPSTKKRAAKFVAKVMGPKRVHVRFALSKSVKPSRRLAAVIGSSPIRRSQVSKKLWTYVKKKGLQDKKKITMINTDDKLKAVFGGKKQVSMFRMTTYVSSHLK